MNSSNRDRPYPAAPEQPASTPKIPSHTGPSDSYANWLDRTQRARARHAAITQNLYTWSNYKSWAERMRTSWEDEKK